MEVSYTIKRKKRGRKGRKKRHTDKEYLERDKNRKYEPRLKEKGEEKRGYRRPN